MTADFKSTFAALRAILEPHSKRLAVKEDSTTCFCLHVAAGPAAVKAWGGEMRKPMIPFAWVEIGKTYVSFHLMGLYGNTKLLGALSKDLKARMQGKTCFNFKSPDAMRKAGFTTDQKPT